MNSPFMWLRGDNSDRGIQCLNFQGTGVSPWMQPRLDPSMMGMQSDMYQAMATAALQEMRAIDYSKIAPASVLQFQQPQGLPCQSSTLMQPQMLHQSQPQQAFLQSVQENQQHSQSQSQAQTQSHHLQPQLQPQQLFNNQQQQHQQQPRQAQPLDHQQIPCTIPAISQFASCSQSQSPSLQTVPSLCQQPGFSDSNCNPVTSPTVSPLHSLAGSFVQDDSAQLLNLQRAHSVIPSAGWPSKRAAIDPLCTGAAQYFLPQVEILGTPQSSISQNTVALPPFPGRECPIDDRDEGSDPQNHVLFGVNIESSSLLMQNGMSNLRGVGNDSVSTTLPFSSNYMSTAGTNFSVNPTMTSSNCIDESGFLQSHENVGQVNPPNGTFVKVIQLIWNIFLVLPLNVWFTYSLHCVLYCGHVSILNHFFAHPFYVQVHKSGTYSRSLDITKFNSYPELRSELARMFGLEGELEDPLRSGWQLVFVDRENDVLLLGDGPWP